MSRYKANPELMDANAARYLKNPPKMRWPRRGGRRLRFNGSPFPFSRGSKRPGTIFKSATPPASAGKRRRASFLGAIRRVIITAIKRERVV